MIAAMSLKDHAELYLDAEFGTPEYWQQRNEMMQALEDIYYPGKEVKEIEYHI